MPVLALSSADAQVRAAVRAIADRIQWELVEWRDPAELTARSVDAVFWHTSKPTQRVYAQLRPHGHRMYWLIERKYKFHDFKGEAPPIECLMIVLPLDVEEMAMFVVHAHTYRRPSEADGRQE